MNDEMSDDTSEKSSEKKNTSRRLSDTAVSKGKKLNLDRRVADRRSDSAPPYKGPCRRKTIDQRVNLKDRREKD
jgi:hypothetical protein